MRPLQFSTKFLLLWADTFAYLGFIGADDFKNALEIIADAKLAETGVGCSLSRFENRQASAKAGSDVEPDSPRPGRISPKKSR